MPRAQRINLSRLFSLIAILICGSSLADETPRQIEGVYHLHNGYQSETLELRDGRFRYWFWTDCSLPKCDAYILMEIIHDWPDREAVTILQAVRQAAPPGATLFLIETIVPEGPQPDWSKMLDIHMLTLLGGKQRTLKEYETLLRQADFEFKEAIDTGTGISIIETLARQT